MAKRGFSSGLLGLKFMQKAQEKDRREELLAEQEKKINEDKWVVKGTETRCRVVVEGTPAPGAVMGRMSFKNFNPQIEALKSEKEEGQNKKLHAARLAKGESGEDPSVSDAEMAKRLAKPNGEDEFFPKRKKQKKSKASK
uniref:M-phase phosphoprotein 6 n=1 Tax=Pyramimonas obovata TaxID=1411642 RepID=A0A7S0N3E8_9CHLO|mmetsp:Transcript_19037/g.41686  ORF Transcript_19037/g.41686 Transcript_19037/m.41686 type:complete len:140 (+) Transcript_19037:220-639(+)|eukprot:CAMPEP_0118932280 /NCGR_PEP_ID=MMETSP1169-20130426/9735_1 /TAXON_ID=36882 /ORGANISM="Pyramimonas obovata, Strain CCMP722" /LENGTH=139 /DNA_ID=CAMNT_0006874913 /DNA_START=197 /DNA_END=616 /DNA_ORIENTATION=-